MPNINDPDCDEVRRELGKLETLVGDVREEIKSFRDAMSDNMRKLTEATLQVARLEMTLVQHGDAMQRGFKRLEDLENRQGRLETDLAAWVNKGRGVWFAITLIGGVLGIGGGYMMTLLDRASIKFFEMQEKIGRMEYLLERHDKEVEDFRKRGGVGNAEPDAPANKGNMLHSTQVPGMKGKIIPLPMPIPDLRKPNTSACNNGDCD